jgi:hypothetical protein
MGVGPRAIGMGGAVTAASDDIFSTFWNPAGLAELNNNQFAISSQLNADLSTVNFVGVAISGNSLQFGDLKSVLSFAWLPRLHINAEGSYGPEDYETFFLRYALPGLPDEFDGKIHSKTYDYRLSFALTPKSKPRWSLGITIARVNCRTDFCGTTAEDPGVYKVVTTDATATSINIGAKYFANDRLTLGISLKDVNTDLKVDTVVTDSSGGSTEHHVTEYPQDLSIGVQWKYSRHASLSADYETYMGKYGSSDIDFKLLRGGWEKVDNNFAYRLGLLASITLETEVTGNIKDDLPAPIGITAGIGWKARWGRIDFAIYPQPVMSYQRQAAYFAADLALICKF